MATTRRRLVIVLSISALIFLALGWSLGWIDAFPGSWRESPGTPHRPELGAPDIASASANLDDRFPSSPLPWGFDFEHRLELPASWLVLVEDYLIRPHGEGRVLVKTAGCRRESDICLMGGFELTDYSVQADVRSDTSEGEEPDIGIISQGYLLEMQGESQRLVLRTWPPPETEIAIMDFPWTPNRWYVMKLKTKIEDGVARLSAKVWPRQDNEPEPWTLHATHQPPNRAGSPGLFGRNSDVEIMYDNIKVVAN